MTLVIRASPSPTSLPIPSIKQNDLQRHREGPLSSPLQNLFLFNGRPRLPFLPGPSPPLAGWLSPPPLPLPPRDSQPGKVAEGYWMHKMVKEQKKLPVQVGRRRGMRLGTQGTGLAAVGGPTPPPGFYGGKKLIRVSEFRPRW